MPAQCVALLKLLTGLTPCTALSMCVTATALSLLNTSLVVHTEASLPVQH
jgi:hypothetical protein